MLYGLSATTHARFPHCLCAVAATTGPASIAAAKAGGGGGMDGQPHMYPCAKLKLDQLFLQWLSLPESQSLVR